MPSIQQRNRQQVEHAEADADERKITDEHERTCLRRLAGEVCAVQSVRYFGWTLISICYWYSKIRRAAYPVSGASQGGLRTGILKAMLALDRLVPMPLGTSLILKGRKA